MDVLKRTVDILVAVCGLILLAPAMALIAVLIKLDDPGPILYKSERMGRGGKPFTILKFRSMYQDSPPRHGPDGTLLVEENDSRVTRVGRVLRAGFDELPQLFNVLKGEMSLVGPRPDPPAARAMYQAGDERRLTVLPGLTGLVQVSGRTEVPWRDRIAYDIMYVEHRSWWLDLEIIFLTVLLFLPPVRRRLQAPRVAGLLRLGAVDAPVNPRLE
jgi:lipopolysaccharide/colanic/teichoic acid biosynthesis glycosyltransferase